jgi:prevent-host-death family protein
MAMKTIELCEAGKQLEELISLAAAGTEVILTQDSTPLARLVPIEPAPQRIAGLNAGTMWMSEDFDEPLPDDFWWPMLSHVSSRQTRWHSSPC